MTRLLFIHGINNEDKNVDQIRSEWGGALNKGMRAAELEELPIDKIECAYYGKLLADGAKKWSMSRGSTPSLNKTEAYDLMYSEMREIFNLKAIVDVDQKTTVAMPSDEYKTNGGKSRGASNKVNYFDVINATGTRGAKAHKHSLIYGAKFFEAISPKLVEKAVGVFLAQAIAYLKDKALHQKINDTVVNQLFLDESRKDEPHIVVTHSNGTLLSYFLFHDRLKDWNIKAWYTIGTPLGAKTMQKYLPKPDGYPGSVDTWYNCWDTEDFVSYNTPLTSETIGIDGVVNINTFDTDYEDKHSILSYLSHAMMARLISSDLDEKFWG